MTEPDPQQVNLSHEQHEPIRNAPLAPELLEQIEAIHDVIGPILGNTFEQFERGFVRAPHPEREVAIWCGITAAWIDYHEDFLDNDYLPDDEEKKLIDALVLVSTGVTDPSALGVPTEIGSRLLDCYDAAGEE